MALSRFVVLLGGCAVLGAAAAGAERPAGTFTPALDAAGFVTTKGSQFWLNGKPFYFAGANCYSLFTYGSGSGDPETQYMNKTEIDVQFAAMAANGVQVVRTDGFNEQSWHGFEPQQGKYNAAQLDEFDYIVTSAAKHGVRLVVTLENYWGDYGGIPQRLQWAGASAQPNQGVFFSTEAAMASYEAYISFFLKRNNQ